MSSGRHSIDAELIRYRIEKRMAGRRDLLLHLLITIGVAVLYRLNVTWLDLNDYFFAGGLWTIPLILHGLRYYYRCGPGAAKRADEIERAIDEQLERSALDEDEELLIEERVSKRVTARRVLAAHALTSVLFLAIYTPFWLSQMAGYPGDMEHLPQLFTWFGIAFALHATRFHFVHGRSPAGRALKIDAEVEREWHRSRERRRTRRERFDREDESIALDLGELQGRRLRLTAEGEFDDAFGADSVSAGRAGGRG